MDILQALDPFLGLVSGLFGGVGAVAVWEIWLKPRRDRSKLAAVLLSELELNEEILLMHQGLRAQDPMSVHGHVNVSTVVFEACRERLAVLDPASLRSLMRLYSHLGQIRVAAESTLREAELIREPGGGNARGCGF